MAVFFQPRTKACPLKCNLLVAEVKAATLACRRSCHSRFENVEISASPFLVRFDLRHKERTCRSSSRMLLNMSGFEGGVIGHRSDNRRNTR